jgi:uncharacterized protein YbjT (DUF2867 family)
MRVAVVGGTGLVGRRTVSALKQAGHEARVVSRSAGVDVLTGAGLDRALAGADAIIDVLNTPRTDPDGPREFFAAATAALTAAGQAAGVGHHVVLSIVGLERIAENPHYAGKQAQERAALAGPVPATILRATHFHDLAGMVVSWTRSGDEAVVPPLLVQPIDVGDVAAELVQIATAPPQGRARDIAGPGRQDLVDMARRTMAARGDPVQIVAGFGGAFGEEMAGEALLPGADARLAATTFDDWLETEAAAAE